MIRYFQHLLVLTCVLSNVFTGL